MDDHHADQRVERVRTSRVFKSPDQTLGFMPAQFKREVARPFKQLEGLAQHWQNLVPPDLLPHTRLNGLARGVLTVSVDSSASLYELDRLLRGGLETELVKAHRGPAMRRIKLVVDTTLAEPGV